MLTLTMIVPRKVHGKLYSSDMVSGSSSFSVLLIDDEIEELALVTRIFKAVTDDRVHIDHAFKCSEAIHQLNQHQYDLVLLDNRLSGEISAEFSAPFIMSSLNDAIVAIISHDIAVPYLRYPESLGVDFVIDKAKIIPFLRDIYAVKTGTLAQSQTRRAGPAAKAISR